MMMPVEAGKPRNVEAGRKSLGGGEQMEKMMAMHAGKMPSMIHPSTSQVMDQTAGEEENINSFFNGITNV
jgi:hypothetical protein